MKKSIFYSMIILTLTSLILMLLAFSVVFYGQLSRENSSIFELLKEIIPAFIAIIIVIGIICYVLAINLTKRIVDPINKVNLKDKLISPYDEFVPFVRTIEKQRERIAQQLSDLQTRSDTINAIMDNMNEGIMFINNEGTVLSVNKSALRIFEKETSIDGKNILEVLRDIDFLEYVRNAIVGKYGETNLERNGKTYRVYFSHVNYIGAIILFLEITENIKAEKIRSEFSANVSHELKTPLTSIYGNAEMLCNSMIKEEDKQETYAKIKDEAGRMIMLIDDIIMISRLDEGGRQELFEEVNLTSVAFEVLESLSQKASENKVTVNISGEDIYMKANPSMIYEMFYNLMDNALKYNKPDGKVNVDIINAEDTIGITVSDTGIGIPKRAQSRVFERFYRVDKSRSRKTGGTGLGLAIVKHIVLAYNGKIELKSVQGEGTSISVVFYL